MSKPTARMKLHAARLKRRLKALRGASETSETVFRGALQEPDLATQTARGSPVYAHSSSADPSVFSCGPPVGLPLMYHALYAELQRAFRAPTARLPRAFRAPTAGEPRTSATFFFRGSPRMSFLTEGDRKGTMNLSHRLPRRLPHRFRWPHRALGGSVYSVAGPAPLTNGGPPVGSIRARRPPAWLP